MPYAVIILTAFLVTLPVLIATNINIGSDQLPHYNAIQALNQAWQDGQFGSRIYPIVSQDFGYPLGLFYSMLPSGICVAIINILGVNVSTALFIQFFLLILITGFVTYFFLKRVFKDTNLYIILFATCCYMVFPYTLSNLYVRFAFAEIHLILAMPLILWGLFELFFRNNPKAFFPLFVSGDMVALFFHFTLFVYINIFVIIFVLINHKKLFTKRYFLPIAMAGLTVILIGAIYWYPMLINYSDSAASTLAGNPWSMMVQSLAYLLPTKWLIFSTLPIFAIFFLFLTLYYKKPKEIRTPLEKHFLIISFCIFSLILPIFPWFILPSQLRSIQFSYRIYSMFSLFACIMIVYIFKNLKTRYFKIFASGVGLVLITAFLSYAAIGGSIPINTITNEVNFLPSVAGVGTAEYGKAKDYYPINSVNDINYILTRANDKMVIDNNVPIWEFANYQSLNQIAFVVEAPSDDSFVILNLPYSLFDKDIAVRYFIYRNYDYSQINNNAGHELTDEYIHVQPADINGTKFVKINFSNQHAYCKTVISYKPDSEMARYLRQHPFEFISSAPDWEKSGGGYATDFIKTGINYTVCFENITAEVTIELPTFYFKGYKIQYHTTDGETINITPSSDDKGFIKVTVNKNGTLSVKYTGESYLTIAGVITFVGIGFFIAAFTGILIYKRKT